MEERSKEVSPATVKKDLAKSARYLTRSIRKISLWYYAPAVEKPYRENADSFTN